MALRPLLNLNRDYLRMTNATMEKLKQKMHIGHHDKADRETKGQPGTSYVLGGIVELPGSTGPTETPKTAPEPVSQAAPTAAVPTQQDEVVPTGVAQAESSTGSTAPVGNEQLDTMTEPIPQPPPHIAQRLEDHREQVSALSCVWHMFSWVCSTRKSRW